MNKAGLRKRIMRTFAIATKEVTVEQFLRFRPGSRLGGSVTVPGPDNAGGVE